MNSNKDGCAIIKIGPKYHNRFCNFQTETEQRLYSPRRKVVFPVLSAKDLPQVDCRCYLGNERAGTGASQGEWR